MLTLYVICAVVGGGFVLLSSFLGGGDHGHDHDADHDLDHDVDHDLDHDVDHDLDHDVDHDVGHADHDVDHDHDHGHDVHGGPVWIPFFSFKFWTFALCFFGVTGLLLNAAGAGGAVTQLLAAGGTGVASGLGVTYGLRKVKQSQISSGISARQLLGMEAQVALPIRKDAPGKIFYKVQERRMEMVADTDDLDGFEQGDEVVVIGIDEGRARVVRRSSFLPEE